MWQIVKNFPPAASFLNVFDFILLNVSAHFEIQFFGLRPKKSCQKQGDLYRTGGYPEEQLHKQSETKHGMILFEVNYLRVILVTFAASVLVLAVKKSRFLSSGFLWGDLKQESLFSSKPFSLLEFRSPLLLRGWILKNLVISIGSGVGH